MYHSLFGNLSFLDHELADHLFKNDTIPNTCINSRELFESYFVVAHHEDEREITRAWLVERKSRITTGHYLRALQISASNACNFGCSYCFADTTDIRRGDRADGSKSISVDMAKEAIERIRSVAESNGHTQIAVKFLGREPLINWKVISSLLALFNDQHIIWALTTNGSLVTPEIARTMGEHKVRTVVSIDGEPKVHNHFRILKDSGAGTFDQAWHGLEVLSQAGCEVSVSAVYTNLSRPEKFCVFIDQLKALNVKELELTLVMQTIKDTAQSQATSSEQLANSLVGIYEYATSCGIFLHGDWINPFHRLLGTSKLRGQSALISPEGSGCSATSHQISLEPSGELFPCRAMATHYGSLENLDQVLNSEPYNQVLMRTYYNVPYCHGCNLEGFCQGTCLGSCEEANDDIYQPQADYCATYRACTNLLLKSYLKRRQLNAEFEANGVNYADD